MDDNSPDGTAEIVKKLQKKYPIILVERPEKMGIGSAYISGFKKALEIGSDIVFEMDSDLSHDPKEISNFVKKINDNFEVVIGSRRTEGGKIIGWRWYRRLISFLGNFIGKYMGGINYVDDLTSGYRAYKKEILKKIDFEKIKSNGYAFQLEILAKCIKADSKVDIIPITFHDRRTGKSKLTGKDIIDFFFIALKLRIGLI